MHLLNLTDTMNIESTWSTQQWYTRLLVKFTVKIKRFLCITFTFEPYTCKEWGKPAKRPEFVATTQIRHIIRVRYVSVYVPYLYHVYIFMYFSKYRLVCLVCLQTQTPLILSFTTRSSWIYILYQIQSRCTCQQLWSFRSRHYCNWISSSSLKSSLFVVSNTKSVFKPAKSCF